MKAAELTRIVLEHNGNQAAAARQLGITRQSVQSRMKKKPAQDILQKFLASKELKKELVKVACDALKAKKPIVGKGGKIQLKPDHKTRHPYWHDLMVGAGGIKNDSGGASVNINLNYGYRRVRADNNDVRDQSPDR